MRISVTRAGNAGLIATIAMAFAGVEPKKPIGGHVLAHASTIRLCVRKGRAEARVLKVMQGPDLKEQDAEFMISNGGVVDIE